MALQTLCKACPRLRKLSIQPHGQWMLRTCQPLAGLRDLSDVLFDDIQASEAAFEDISKGCPHLTRLELLNCGM